MFSLFMTSAQSNDITNIFVKSILVQKIAFTSIYDIVIYMILSCPLNISNKEQRFASLITVKNRQLSTVPLNFD